MAKSPKTKAAKAKAPRAKAKVTRKVVDPETNVETEVEEEVESDEVEEDEEEGVVHEFDGEPLPVEVGDYFESKGNPGGRVLVTPEILANLIARKKALPVDDPRVEQVTDPNNPTPTDDASEE